MNISSASKKVLASALSAAMVVAFAPTVAFAAASGAVADGAKTVDVTFDANGGTLKGVAGETVQLLKDADGKYYINIGSVTNPEMTNGYSFSKWFIDEDGDGLLGSSEKSVDSDNYVEVAADATAVTLKAAYTMPTASIGTFAGTTYTVAGQSDNTAKVIPVTVSAGMLTAGHTYTLKLTCPDGTSSDVAVFGSGSGQTQITGSEATVNVNFSDLAVSSDKAAFLAAHLTSGTYTAELSDGSKVISKAATKLAKVTVKAGDETASALVQLNTQGTATVDLTGIKALPTGYAAYLEGEYSVGDGKSVTVKGDTEFTATKVAQAAGTVSYTEDVDGSSKLTGKAGQLSFAINAVTGASKYAVTVTDPSDATVYTGEYTSEGTKTVSFDTKSGGARTTASEQAGDYVVTVATTVGTGADAKTTESKAKMTLTQVKYEAGDNAFFAKNAVTSYFTDEAAWSSVQINAPAATPKDGYAADYVTLNGAKYDAKKNDVKAGAVNTYAYVQKAVAYAAAPAYTVVEKVAGTAKQYVLTITPAAGTSVSYTVDSGSATSVTGATSVILPSTAGTVTLTASDAASKATPKTITLKNATGAAKAWSEVVSGSTSHLELNIGKSTTKWLAADGVKAAVESGKAGAEAVAAKYFAESAEIDAADLAAKKALYEAVVAEADAQVAAYKDGANVVVGDKVYTMTAAQYKAATEKAAEAAKTAESAVKAASTDFAKAAAYVTAMNTAIGNANDALKAATENKSVKAADITAAQEVTAQLKAAKDADAAKAALEAYNKLTDGAKALVSTADVTAAQKVVSDAEAKAALVNAQDLAAARDLNGKKVTAKAKVGKKAQGKSFAYKLAASESGATASYAKVSGSKYIKISASGKVTFSKVKVQKKAKTYKAKVSVTYGTQTVTKTVQLVVKKK